MIRVLLRRRHIQDIYMTLLKLPFYKYVQQQTESVMYDGLDMIVTEGPSRKPDEAAWAQHT